MGKILNLMRNDVYEVAQRFWEFPDIFTKPLRLLVSVVLIWKLLGWPCLFGVTAVIVAQLLNAVYIRLLLRWERVRRVATDKRLHATSQFIEAIRHLRWYDWQDQWLAIFSSLIGTTNLLAGCLFPVVAFYAYTLLAGRPLSVDIAFPALQLFNMLAVSLRELPGLITTLLNASVAVGRINEFMSEPDKEEKYSELRGSDIAFHDASFAWPGSSTAVLDNLNLRFPPGLTIIVGKVGTAPLEDDAAEEDKKPDSEPDKFIEDEHRKQGEVVASVYWEYIKAGKIRWWIALLLIFALFRMTRLFNYWFLKAWGEAYQQSGEQSFSDGLASFFDRLPPPEVNVRPWLVWFLIIALSLATMYFLSDIALLIIVYTAGKRLYREVIWKVSRATFRFYDVTPVGRLMNRVTSDIGTLDGGISDQLQSVAWYAIGWVAAIVVIASVTPLFLIASLALTAWFVYIFMRFLPTSQSLRRLEMVSLSPLMSNFGVLLNGLTTIRAFRAQPRFQDRVIVVTDAFQKMDHFYWSLQAWLTYRFDALSAFSSFGLTLLALYEDLTPGLTAFMLTSASNFVLFTHSLCKQYGKLQMDFVSVERVVELLHLEEEPVGTLEPPASWPGYGDDIVFENVTIKYAPHLEASLSDISFHIPGGSTVAIVGRTGSGKSTLALTLLRTVLPEAGGSIHVGNIDISKVDVHTWRQRITFVAQDPVLFPGSMRENLDPVNQHSDEECAAVLHRVLGADWSLSSHIDGGGKNMSQGQRQLVGLGRAILRRSPIIVLDEATASIDKETALAIQEVLRDELKESTVITIAHRVEAVKNADYCIVLDNGRVVANGTPEEVAL
ncbi:putative ABC transporter protein [Neofusicoccum parvum]|uniref:ABC transporter protein n=1 Tax=Neofusicoccum parvum TaxID=310453 RepID=A0ACB5S8Z9_9PEZI|nr:putative ABC transporter protein [Neofusicoccum parvum]